jgi:hypothetical protein
MEVLTAVGIEELNKFIATLRTIRPNLAWEASQAFVPYSSDSSREIYSKLIELCQEVVEHNDTNHWSREENKQKIRKFRQLFDGGMENFSPACFDQLSAQVATAYLGLLDTLQKKVVFSSSAKALIDTGSLGNFKKLISFVRNNTQHLIYLFELVCKQKISEHADLREEQLAYALIKAAVILLGYIEKNKQTEELADANKAYAELTKYAVVDSKAPPEPLPETLTVEEVIAHYTASVSGYVITLLNARVPMIGFAGLDGEMGIKGERLSKVIGENAIRTIDDAGTFHNPFKDLAIKYLKESRLKALAAEENALFQQAKSLSREEITSAGGFLEQLKNQFSPEIYTKNLVDLAEKFKEIKEQLKGYKAGGNLSFLAKAVGGTNPEKIIIANDIISKTRELLRTKEDSAGRRLFFADYLAEMLITILQSDADHAHIVRTNSNVSYGSLGGLIAQFITDLYTFMDKIDLSCSPSVFYEFLEPAEQVELLAAIKPAKAEKIATATA